VRRGGKWIEIACAGKNDRKWGKSLALAKPSSSAAAKMDTEIEKQIELLFEGVCACLTPIDLTD
jgi:hypothetical protein